MISESTNIIVNALLGGLSGLLIWLSVELAVERLKNLVIKGNHSLKTPDRNSDFWVQNSVQYVNLAIFAGLFAGPIEVRWLYLALGFGAGAVLCGITYHLVRQRKIQVDLDWLFR